MTALPPSGHELSPRVETPEQRRRKLASGARFRTVAVVLTATYLGVLGWVAYQEWPLDGDQWTSLVTGVACGLVVFFALPWSIGSHKRRQARQVMRLNGHQITVTGGSRKAGGTFDLGRIRAEVRLSGPGDSGGTAMADLTDEQRQARIDLIRKSLDRNTNAGITPRLYTPTLVLHGDDGTKLPILLADNKSGEMRSPAEIHMLERALHVNPDPATRHAVAQLRTVARWSRLPAVYDARPDAIPPTPVDHPFDAPPPPTPVYAGAVDPLLHIEGGGWAHPFGDGTGSAGGAVTA